MNPRVLKANPGRDYTLMLTFTNQEVKEYDFTPLLDFGIFKELRDFNYFKQVKVRHGTVCWPHGQDICPDTLYLDARFKD